MDATQATLMGSSVYDLQKQRWVEVGGIVVVQKMRKPEPSCCVTMGNCMDSQGISKVPAQLSLGSAKQPDAGAK